MLLYYIQVFIFPYHNCTLYILTSYFIYLFTLYFCNTIFCIRLFIIIHIILYFLQLSFYLPLQLMMLSLLNNKTGKIENTLRVLFADQRSTNAIIKAWRIFLITITKNRNSKNCDFLTEKEGFEPSRRSPDLHPQQGRLFSLLRISPARIIILEFIFIVNIVFPFFIFFIFSQLCHCETK